MSVGGVSFSYDGAVPALDGVDLNIEDGEFFCILGGNGSGKSTFAKHLNALLQPDAGTVCVNGMDASDPELVYDIRSTAGMVFQNPDDQLVATLVEDDVAFGPENLGVESAQIAQRVREALKAVGLVALSATRPMHSRVAKSSAWRLPACSPWSRACSSWMRRLDARSAWTQGPHEGLPRVA